MKVVFDTNVYIAEYLTGGLAERVIEATLDAGWRVYISDYLLDEFRRVMKEHFHQPQGRVARASHLLQPRSTLVQLPASHHRVEQDPDDSPILQTAIVASAHLLVSRDRHLLNLNPYESLQILSVASYHQLLQNLGLI